MDSHAQNSSSQMMRASSLQLHAMPRSSIAVYAWGRNDCGQLGIPPYNAGPSITHDGSNSSSSMQAVNNFFSPEPHGPPGIISYPVRVASCDGKDVVHIAADLYNTALLTGGSSCRSCTTHQLAVAHHTRSQHGILACGCWVKVYVSNIMFLCMRRLRPCGIEACASLVVWREAFYINLA